MNRFQTTTWWLFAATILASCYNDAAKVNSSTDSIIGGTTGAEKKYPFLVKIEGTNGICSGSVLSDHTILTAAHCGYSEDTGKPDNFLPGSAVKVTSTCSSCGEPVQNAPGLRIAPFKVQSFLVSSSYQNEVTAACNSGHPVTCSSTMQGVNPRTKQSISDVALLQLTDVIPSDIPRGHLILADNVPPSFLPNVAGFGCSVPKGRGSVVDAPLWITLGKPLTKNEIKTGNDAPDLDIVKLAKYWALPGGSATVCEGDSGGPTLFNSQIGGVNSAYRSVQQSDKKKPDNTKSALLSWHAKITPEVLKWIQGITSQDVSNPSVGPDPLTSTQRVAETSPGGNANNIPDELLGSFSFASDVVVSNNSENVYSERIVNNASNEFYSLHTSRSVTNPNIVFITITLSASDETPESEPPQRCSFSVLTASGANNSRAWAGESYSDVGVCNLKITNGEQFSFGRINAHYAAWRENDTSHLTVQLLGTTQDGTKRLSVSVTATR